MTDIVQILKEMQQEEDCPMLVHMAFSEAISEITRLRAELAQPSSTSHAGGKTRRDSSRHRGGTGEAHFG